MKFAGLWRILSLALALLISTLAIAHSPQSTYHLLKKYTFGAAEGSNREYFDYITVDSVGAARLPVARHGNESN